MNNFHTESINRLAARWADAVWAISWQFCVLGLIVLVVHWSLRRAAPNWRYWLWQILAIKLLLMPFWTAAAPWKSASNTADAQVIAKPDPPKSVGATAPAAAPKSDVKISRKTPGQPVAPQNELSPQRSQPAVEREVTQPPIPHAPPTNVAAEIQNVDSPQMVSAPAPRKLPNRMTQGNAGAAGSAAALPSVAAPTVGAPQPQLIKSPTLSWQAWLMLAWVGGITWYSGRIIWQGISLGRRLRETIPADSAVIMRVREAATQLEMTQLPDVRVIDLEISPFVCGLWRPRLIIPSGLSQSFTSEQLDLVLLHELAHIRRRDLVWGWIPEVAKVIFFFHPVVHYLCYQIRFERELACDQLAMLTSGRDVATYADTLVRVVGQFSAPDSFRIAAAETPSI